MNRNNTILAIVGIIILILFCCFCILAVVGVGGFLSLLNISTTYSDFPSGFSPLLSEPLPTPVVIRPEDPTVQVLAKADALETLESTIVPVNDPRQLAMRLEGKGEIPLTLPSAPRQIGDQDTFWVTNNETNESFQISATLRYETDHVYFWVQDEVNFRARDVADLSETFENEIYPTTRNFFGSEWNPGIDEDPHIYILLAADLGDSIAGYFSGADAFHPLANEFSNAHEMFLVNADNVDLRDEFTYGVLAHEFQHMIHWNLDRNEVSWINEGFSELAMLLNGYSTAGAEIVYTLDPDIQLNDWPDDPAATYPHYGAAFLFTTYFLDRFGESATQALAAHPANGLASVDAVLEELYFTDPLTKEPITGDDVFLDWVLASYLQDPSVADSRFAYSNFPAAPQPDNTETFSACTLPWQTRDVRQYGVDYIRILCQRERTLHFEGSTQVSVVPADPYSGDFFFWSNKGDESDMTLSQTFDFRNHDGPLTLTYWTWYDLEEDWDYAYLEASLDGETWEILITPSGTAEDPTGNSYGWGYTGPSGGGPAWIQESIDLSRFAGQEVTLRFEYITDAAVNGEGLLLDDIAIPEIGYFTDFELDDGGWEAAGFVRIQNRLPQSYGLALITTGDTTQVKQIQLEADNSIDIPLDLGGEFDEVILVVTGVTRFTRQSAPYRFALDTE